MNIKDLSKFIIKNLNSTNNYFQSYHFRLSKDYKYNIYILIHQVVAVNHKEGYLTNILERYGTRALKFPSLFIIWGKITKEVLNKI